MRKIDECWQLTDISPARERDAADGSEARDRLTRRKARNAEALQLIQRRLYTWFKRRLYSWFKRRLDGSGVSRDQMSSVKSPTTRVQ